MFQPMCPDLPRPVLILMLKYTVYVINGVVLAARLSLAQKFLLCLSYTIHTMYSSRKDSQIHLEEGLAVYDGPRS